MLFLANLKKCETWVIDLGDSDHMIRFLGNLENYTPCINDDKVHTIDKSLASIIHKGSIACTVSIVLSNFLHVLPNNLLSLSALKKLLLTVKSNSILLMCLS